MKHLARHALSLALLLSTQAICFSQAIKPSSEPTAPVAEYNDDAWKEFASSEGRFTVLMPGVPKELAFQSETKSGVVRYKSFTVRTPSAIYYVMYSDSAEPPKTADQLRAALDLLPGMLPEKEGWTFLSKKEAVQDGAPARDWLATSSLGVMTRRAFFAGGRLYFVTVFTTPNVAFKDGKSSADPSARTELYERITSKFFGSFHLLPAQGGSATSRNTDPGPGIGSGVAVPEGEVDRFLREQKERGGVVIGRCLDEAHCHPVGGEHVVTGGLVEGHALERPAPEYPAIARVARASGPVVVQMVVDEEGKVVAAQVVSGPTLLRAAALKAAREWRFTPTLLDGHPVKVTGTVTFTFTLQ